MPRPARKKSQIIFGLFYTSLAGNAKCERKNEKERESLSKRGPEGKLKKFSAGGREKKEGFGSFFSFFFVVVRRQRWLSFCFLHLSLSLSLPLLDLSAVARPS